MRISTLLVAAIVLAVRGQPEPKSSHRLLRPSCDDGSRFVQRLTVISYSTASPYAFFKRIRKFVMVWFSAIINAITITVYDGHNSLHVGS